MKSAIILLTVFALFFSAKKPATTVTLKQIGDKNFLFEIRGMDYFAGNLYTLDYLLTLNRINLETGEISRVGKVTYKNKKFFFALNGKLYIIENDGSMTEVDIESGEWKVISNITVWSRTERAFTVRNTLYTIENGALYQHRGPVYDSRSQKGGSEFYNPGLLIRGIATLYSIQGEGSLYEINLSDGSWKRIGKGKLWKGTKAAAVFGDKLYAVDQAGKFSETSLVDGTKTVLDETQFTDAKLMFAESGKLYVGMTAGNLYQVILDAAK